MNLDNHNAGLIGKVRNIIDCRTIAELIQDPFLLSHTLREKISYPLDKVIIGGSIEKRIIIIKAKGKRSIIVSLGDLLGRHKFVEIHRHNINIDDLDNTISYADIDEITIAKLQRPHVKLIALAHHENFPLPRFSLGISDIARALRENMIGRVSLVDMQLEKDIEKIINAVNTERPEIIGISVTFGQQDLLEFLIDGIEKNEYNPLIVAGGSLAALNYIQLLTKYPNLIVAMGFGEITMCDIVRYWCDELHIEKIHDIAYRDKDRSIKKTQKIKYSNYQTIIPELDLLSSTLSHNGVMLLESSRGCSCACSFCGRGHKGNWTSLNPSGLEILMPLLSQIYDYHSYISRKIFFVDEEFLGYNENLKEKDRIINICKILKKHNFTFEVSSRIDQVFRRGKNKDWHIARMRLWKYLAANGLDKVLFGVESGVDSVLSRFKKNTTSSQNVYAIRILSSCNVPVRFTYITFDPLMSLTELILSYKFLGRKDLLLSPAPDMREEEIFINAQDDNYALRNNLREPFYRHISYMLVSLECLMGSEYLKWVEQRELGRDLCLSMGKRHANYLDLRIGLLSYYSQLWIDRNFSLDYTLKSIEKICSKDKQIIIRDLRNMLRDYSYSLLGKMVSIVSGDLSLLPDDSDSKDILDVKSHLLKWDYSMRDTTNNELLLTQLLHNHFLELVKSFSPIFLETKNKLTGDVVKIIENVFNEWRTRKKWKLINTL